MFSSSRLQQAVADCTQPFGTQHTKDSYCILEDYLSDSHTCDDVYEAIGERIINGLDQPPVINQCCNFLKRFLLRYHPSSDLVHVISRACKDASNALKHGNPGLDDSLAYITFLLESVSHAQMGNKSSRQRKQSKQKAIAELATGANDSRNRGRSKTPVKAPVAQPFADSAFLQRPVDMVAANEQSGKSDAQGKDGSNTRDGIASADSPSLPSDMQQRAGLSAASSPQVAYALHEIPGAPVDGTISGAVPCNLLQQRWQLLPMPEGTPPGAEWPGRLQHCTTSLFASHAEAEEAHTAAPVLRLQGDTPNAPDSTVAIALQPQGIEHLQTVAQIQMEQMKEPGRSGRAGKQADQGKFQPGHRPLFLYRPYVQQERLEMDVIETAAVVGIVLGTAAAGNLLGFKYADFLGPDILGNDPWNVSLGKRPQGQAMASILMKLIMDMWIEMPASESLPLILSMLQAALHEEDPALRARVFDLLYNLSLHAHVMVPMNNADDEAESGDIFKDDPYTPNTPTTPATDATSPRENNDYDSQLPPRVVAMQQWLRSVLYQLLLDAHHLNESSPGVWSAALGCLIHSVTCKGAIMQSALSGLSTSVLARLLRQAHDFGWSFELQSLLIRMACNMMYTAGSPVVNGTSSHTDGVFVMSALSEFGGAQNIARNLRCCPSPEAQLNLLAVLLDAACFHSGLQPSNQWRVILSSDKAASALVLAIRAGQPGMSKQLTEVILSCAPSVSRISLSGDVRSLLNNLERLVQPTGRKSAGEWAEHSQGLIRECLSLDQATQAGAWAMVHAATAADDETSQECAVHLMADTLWHGRLQDVKHAVGNLFPVPSRSHSQPSLWEMSLMPGPNVVAHLPPGHALIGFFKPLETALLDKSKRARVAHTLVHILHRLMSTFLWQKNQIFGTNPGGISATTHHVYVVVATLNGAVEWLALLPKHERYVPLTWVTHLMLETLSVTQPLSHVQSPRQLSATPLLDTTPHAAIYPLSQITLFLKGTSSIPSLAVTTLTATMMKAIRDGVTPVNNDPSQPGYLDPSTSAFKGWYGLISSLHTPVAAPGDGGPARGHTTNHPHGLVTGLCTARDARLAVYVILLGRCRMDDSALRSIGGTADLLKAMDDEDARLRFVVADYILGRASRHKEADLQSALKHLFAKAQANNNGSLLENPYVQLQAFISNRLMSLHDL